MSLTDDERGTLRRLGNGKLYVLANKTPSPKVQSLIDRGYIKLSKVRSGPLGIYTGELSPGLTEAGQEVLKHLE